MRKGILIFLEVVVICVTIGVAICNAIHNINFWEVSIAQILTLIIAVGVAFFATQYKADERKQKEHAESIVLKIQAAVSDDCFTRISCSEDSKNITMRNRKINNAIDLLKQYAKLLKFKEDAKYIENEFKQYRSFVEEKIGDLDYLSKSESTLRKYAENISSKCDTIIFRLYK